MKERKQRRLLEMCHTCSCWLPADSEGHASTIRYPWKNDESLITTFAFRQHSHFVLSQIQFIKCLSLFIEPLLVFLICTHNTLSEWRMVFLFHGVLLIGNHHYSFPSAPPLKSSTSSVGNIIFCYFATDRPAAFTHIVPTEEPKDVEPPEQQR